MLRRIRIDTDYFAELEGRFQYVFDNVDHATELAVSANPDNLLRLLEIYRTAIKNYQNQVDFDIYAISSVFNTNSDTIKKRATDIIGEDLIKEIDENGVIGKDIYGLKPDLDYTRQLEETQYGFITSSDGNLVYDHPVKLEKYLYREQGSAYDQYQGTCGLCSSANMLRMAGVSFNEKDMIDYAVEHGLCVKGGTPGENGGTYVGQRQALLSHFGLECDRYSSPQGSQSAIENISQFVSEGKGVNIAVYARTLYDDAVYDDSTHSIIVTSVKKSPDGDILGFYVCDSNKGTPSYYSADVIRESLCGADMLVTNKPIR